MYKEYIQEGEKERISISVQFIKNNHLHESNVETLIFNWQPFEVIVTTYRCRQQ